MFGKRKCDVCWSETTVPKMTQLIIGNGHTTVWYKIAL